MYIYVCIYIYIYIYVYLYIEYIIISVNCNICQCQLAADILLCASFLLHVMRNIRHITYVPAHQKTSAATAASVCPALGQAYTCSN